MTDHEGAAADRRPRPLDGVRVVDLTRVLSGPHCTRMLCDLGADVIKVEPPAGDMTRFSAPRINSIASYFAQQNVGKRNVSLDLGRPAGRDLLARLIGRCDVVVENFRPGVMDRMGLGYAALAERHPRLIYASISGYGQTGPWRHRRAYAPVVGAESGLTRAQGDARARLTGQAEHANDPHSHADVYTGMECAAAVLAALFQRERTGRGDHIDVSMAQTMLYVNEHVHDHLWDGPTDPNWIRSFLPGEYPLLTAANGEVVVTAGHPAERAVFAMYTRAMERPELAADPRFADVASRLEHHADLLAVLREWAATVPTADAIEQILDRHGLATGTLRTVRELCETDWAAEREVIAEVSDRGGGSMRVPNSPWRFDGSDVRLRGEPRYRGEDNREVLAELLGLDDTMLDTLEADGVLSSRLP
jgi:crotonobetainyl-CoA:carnitine CoA-transferase CaiB-like acyl-CoA transferase